MASRLRGSSFPPGLLGLGKRLARPARSVRCRMRQRARSHSTTMCALVPAAASGHRHPGRQHCGDNNRDQRGDDQPGAYNAVHPHVVTRDLSGGRCNTVRWRTRVRFRTAGRAGVCVRRRETPAPDEQRQSSEARTWLSHPWGKRNSDRVWSALMLLVHSRRLASSHRRACFHGPRRGSATPLRQGCAGGLAAARVSGTLAPIGLGLFDGLPHPRSAGGPR
jgi:hypothetical protein